MNILSSMPSHTWKMTVLPSRLTLLIFGKTFLLASSYVHKYLYIALPSKSSGMLPMTLFYHVTNSDVSSQLVRLFQIL